jgi:hypothetical protein
MLAAKLFCNTQGIFSRNGVISFNEKNNEQHQQLDKIHRYLYIFFLGGFSSNILCVVCTRNCESSGNQNTDNMYKVF